MNIHPMFALLGFFFFLVELVIIVAVLAGIWKVFVKAGQPGWACIIPIYNIYCLVKIAGKEWWWLLLFFIPIVNIIVGILVALGVAEKFGQSALFGIGLAFLPFIFYPILGFGDAVYGGAPPPVAAAV